MSTFRLPRITRGQTVLPQRHRRREDPPIPAKRKYQPDGIGDAAILVDAKSGRIWLAALWSHGDRGWETSRPGMTPEETGQLLLTYSDNDGRSWAAFRNITRMVKDPAWRLCFNGPGAGISMKNGTLVFPAMFRSADGGKTRGKPLLTILWSKVQGVT